MVGAVPCGAKTMISPTGQGIRVDSEGDGNYGTSRGERRHNGIDYLCDPGQGVVAPFDMILERESFPNPDQEMTGIAWRKGKSTGRMWYFKPYKRLIGKLVYEGEEIGIAQDVSGYYGLPNMNPHIHFQVKK